MYVAVTVTMDSYCEISQVYNVTFLLKLHLQYRGFQVACPNFYGQVDAVLKSLKPVVGGDLKSLA